MNRKKIIIFGLFFVFLQFFSLCSILSLAVNENRIYSDNIASYWTMDEITTFSPNVKILPEETQNDNAGIIYGAVEDSINDSINFDGEDDHIIVPHDESLILGEFSVMCWVKFNDLKPTNFEGLVAKINATGSDFGWALDMELSNKVTFWINDGSWQSVEYDASSWENDTWYHIAGVYTGLKIQIYINGDLKQEKDVGTMKETITDLIIGSLYADNPQAFLNGSLDDVMIYKKDLNEEQVEDFYLNGIGYTQAQIGLPTLDIWMILIISGLVIIGVGVIAIIVSRKTKRSRKTGKTRLKSKKPKTKN